MWSENQLDKLTMKEIKVKDVDLQRAAAEGMDEFLKVFTDAIYAAIGGELTAENMSELNSDQITLLGYVMLRDEVMDGGFVQLIHNGLGGFIYLNPFDKAMRNWGIADLYRIINKSHALYKKNRELIEADCTDDEFQALYEQCPEFDDFDDAFVEGEDGFTRAVAHYVDENIERFATVVD